MALAQALAQASALAGSGPRGVAEVEKVVAGQFGPLVHVLVAVAVSVAIVAVAAALVVVAVAGQVKFQRFQTRPHPHLRGQIRTIPPSCHRCWA